MACHIVRVETSKNDNDDGDDWPQSRFPHIHLLSSFILMRVDSLLEVRLCCCMEIYTCALPGTTGIDGRREDRQGWQIVMAAAFTAVWTHSCGGVGSMALPHPVLRLGFIYECTHVVPRERRPDHRFLLGKTSHCLQLMKRGMVSFLEFPLAFVVLVSP